MSILIKGISLKQFYKDLNDVRDRDADWDIVQLPADVVERKRGKWIATEFISSTYYRCSECNASYECENADFDFNFCPNCGAEMRESEGNE